MFKQYLKRIFKTSTNLNSKFKEFLQHPIVKFGLVIILTCNVKDGIAQQKTLGLTKNLVGSTADGYVLFAPMGSKTTYLIDKCGKKINSWVSQYSPGLSVYLLPTGHLLRTGISNDTFFIGSGKGGIIEKMDWDGNVEWSYKISNDSLAQHHDIFPMDNGNILVIAWHGLSIAEAEARGRIKGTIGGSKLWSERILELKPKGNNEAEVVWQWSLRDHLIQDASISKPDFNMISSHPELMNINFVPMAGPDWIHMNSLDYNKDLDQILISCHNNSEIWIIDHSTTTAQAASHQGGNSGMGGDLLYRWGNPIAYNKGTKTNQKFFKQHNATWIPKGFKDEGGIMVFNNGLGRSPFYSSVEIIAPPVNSLGKYNSMLPFGPSAQKWIYKDSIPTSFYSAVISGASRLYNGNTLICSGNSGKFFEINEKNKVVWEYISPVNSGDDILSDGEFPSGNAVFRCNYYPSTYGAFKNRILTPSTPVEKNSFSYSCQPSDLDNFPPFPLSFLPVTGSKSVVLNPSLTIQFNENIVAGLNGEITIYQNNQLKETIKADDPRVVIENKSVTFSSINNFTFDSRISIGFNEGCFKDLLGNKCLALDTSGWHFTTKKATSSYEFSKNENLKFYPNPTSGKLILNKFCNPSSLRITDQIGRNVEFTINKSTQNHCIIDISQLPDGLYFIQTDDGTTQRIIKLSQSFSNH